MHYTIPTLYQEEALVLVRAFASALYTDDLQVTYLQVNGVRVELPTYREGFAFVSQSDFEKILDIFEGDTYGDRLRQQRESGIPNQAFYDRLIQEAVEASFPAFP